MKLYFSPGACSQAPHYVLNESGLTFTVEPVNLVTGHYKKGDFTQVNPKGYVPVLELDNGEILTEAAVIMQYIADQAPDKKLIPKAGTLERYRCQEWLNYISSEIHKGFGVLWVGSYPEEIVKTTRATLEEKFAYVAKQLGTKSFLMGDYTIADAYLFTMLNWARYHKLELTKTPELLGFMEKMKTRPATVATLKTEGFIK
ncbi:MAG: glutathione transferase GstA [Oligoflexia bacterium]|nr:glutathione transferase GstA [Oligoflexia bacterium]